MASRHVPVLWRDEAEQTAIVAVAKQMAAHFDAVAGHYVRLRDAVLHDRVRIGRFERPYHCLALLALDLEVNPGVREEPMHFLDRSLERRPLRRVVVIVGVMSTSRQDQDQRNDDRKDEGFELHLSLPGVSP